MLPVEVELENCSCPLGCVPNDELVVVGRDRLHDLPGTFRVVKCLTCHLMRTNPRPTPQTIGYYYPSDYGPFQTTRVQRTRPSRSWRRMLRRMLSLNNDCIPPVQTGRLIEFGCGAGIFLHQMALQGWEVEGVELNADAAKSAQALGYDVHIGSIEDMPGPSQMYDLVVGWMVLEHLHDPVSALCKLRRWTRRGGWLAVSTPNAASLEFSAFKDAWFALQVPTHLYHFTPRTLRKVLEAGGWRMERTFHQRVVGNLVASLGYVLQDRHAPKNLTDTLVTFPGNGTLQYAFYPVGFLFALFGQTGRMTVWARNPGD
jgi:2-polyprenyl-3-methyl-5-hydroxy-6-metoxy-1,4-benzoquinol methylase